MGAVANSSTVSLLQLANGYNRICNVTSITATGSGSVTVPDYATSVVIIAVGAGGGGATNTSSLGWGGAGGSTIVLRRAVTPGQTISYIVGAGGSGGSGAAAAGGRGGNSNVTIGGTTYVGHGGEGGYPYTRGSGFGSGDGDNFSQVGEDGIDQPAGGYAGWSIYHPNNTDQVQVLDPLSSTVGQGGAGSATASADPGEDGAILFKWGACPVRTDVYITGTSQTITAPANANFVVIKAWGAGGGGGGRTIGVGGGGGGGGFVVRRMPVTGGSTQFTYSVGVGGTAQTGAGPGGNGGNTTVSGGTTLDAGGGRGGTISDGGAGGIASGGDYGSEAGTAGIGNTTGVPGPQGRAQEINGLECDLIRKQFTYVGYTDPNDEVIKYVPGYGGAGGFNEYPIDSSDPGIDGEIRFEWFGFPRLTQYKANATITTGGVDKIEIPTLPNNAAGHNGMIVETGTIELLDMRDATHVNLDSSFSSTASAVVYGEPANAYAKAYLEFYSDGRLRVSSPAEDANDGETPNYLKNQWLYHNAGLINSATADEFDVRVTKTSGTHELEGLANNTWYNISELRTWFLDVSAFSSSGIVTLSNTSGVLIEVRRTDTDTIVATGTCNVSATASARYGEQP